MIVDFSVTNFRSIKDEQTLSLYVEQPGTHLPENVCFPGNDKIGVLKAVGLYGANASGKSNILVAFWILRHIVLHSEQLKEGDLIPFYDKPFLLSENTKDAPIRFEIEFFINETRYRYTVSFSKYQIEEESLIFYPSTQPASIFKREPTDTWKTIKFGTQYKGGKRRLAFFKNNAYLSTAGNSADSPELIRAVYQYFKNLIHLGVRESIVSSWKDNEVIVSKISKLLSFVDTGIFKINLEENENNNQFPEDIPEEIKRLLENEAKYKITFSHLAESGELAKFTRNQESEGTQKLFNLAPLLLSVLQSGGILILDELDNSMHPFMAELIIKLFNDPRVNKGNAQLIFSTHNISLMNPDLLRRDQIWFTEKNNGATVCYSLDDFDKKKVKPQSPFNRWYAEGRFGAIPRIDYEGIVQLFNDEMSTENA